MTTLTEIREAERVGDWLRVGQLAKRLGWAKDWRIEDNACPHCGRESSGLGAWGDNYQDFEKMRDEVGLVYRCKITKDETDGCGGLFVSSPWSNGA